MVKDFGLLMQLKFTKLQFDLKMFAMNYQYQHNMVINYMLFDE